MNRNLVILLAALIGTACSSEQAPVVEETASHGEQAAAIEESASFSVDRARITVSGVSSGAYMAGQLHVAYSDVFSGVGLLAGGPYGCSMAELTTALGPCLKGGEINVDELLERTRAAESAGTVAPLANLADDTAWVFHSPTDPVVSPDTSAASMRLYESLGANVIGVDDVAVIHGFPTLDAGVACDAFESPYVNACGYDAAGSLLSALGATEPPVEVASGSLETIPVPGAVDAEMLDFAYLYVPEACAAGEPCGVHVALHGCVQSAEVVDDAFATLTGYNRWADSNRLFVLYPQVESSAIAPLNPNGCWDWWGYTGDDYAGRSAAQMTVIVDLISTLAATE